MKIFYCIVNMGGGGAERQLCYLAGELVRQGHDVHVAVGGGGVNLERLKASNATVYELTSRSSYDWRIVKQLIKLIRKIKPDLVHTWLLQMDVLGGFAAMLTRTPLVLAERNIGQSYQAGWKHKLRVWLGKKAKAIIANSKDGKEYWQGKIGVNKNIKVIKNSIPFEEISNSIAKIEKAELPADTKLIVYAGRLIEQKNLYVLMQALQLVFKDFPNYQAVALGEGPLKDGLIAETSRLGIQGQVAFKGYSSDILGWFKRADLFVSVSNFEGTPNTVLEAIACKCPLVLSDISAHREILDDDSACFANLKSPEDIAKAIVKSLDQPDLMQEKTKQAYNKITQYSSYAIAKEYINLYHGITGTS